MSCEPALLTSAGRMPERSQHRVSEGQEIESERPATGHGQPRTVARESSPPYSGSGSIEADIAPLQRASSRSAPKAWI